MSAQILQFPTYADRSSIHDLLNMYAIGKYNRNTMMHKVADIITKLNLTKIPVFDYSICIFKYHGVLPIISIVDAQLSNGCPNPDCRSNNFKYFRTENENHDDDFDLISLICIDCGKVYFTKAANHRTKYIRSID